MAKDLPRVMRDTRRTAELALRRVPEYPDPPPFPSPFDLGDSGLLASTDVDDSWRTVGTAQTIWAPAEYSPVNVLVHARGNYGWIAMANPQIIKAFLEVSFDNGSSYTGGEAAMDYSVANEPGHLSCMHRRSGTPTGQVKARVRAAVTAGWNGTWVTMSEWTIDWTLMPG